MHIVVTGGAGFIGSNLVRALASRGHKVYVVDSLHTGKEDILGGMEGVRLFRADSGSLGDLPLPFIDCIFHFGMPSSSPMYLKDTGLEKATADEFRSLLEYARTGDSGVVFASTSSLYAGLDGPQREVMPVTPVDGYTRSRFAMEKLADEYSGKHGLCCTGLRLFSVYGPGEEAKGKYANVVSQFLWDMRKGKRPVLYGDGTQTRDFVYVKDVVSACLKAMKYGGSGIFNVGTGRPTSMNDAVDVINRVLGTDMKPLYVENPIKHYVYHTHADCRKAAEVLGFRARYDLEQGISDLLTVRPANA